MYTDVKEIWNDSKELIERLTRFFRTTILGFTLENFIYVSTSIYRVNLMINTGNWSTMDYLDFASILFWLSIKIGVLYFLCTIPDLVTKQACFKLIFIKMINKIYKYICIFFLFQSNKTIVIICRVIDKLTEKNIDGHSKVF